MPVQMIWVKLLLRLDSQCIRGDCARGTFKTSWGNGWMIVNLHPKWMVKSVDLNAAPRRKRNDPPALKATGLTSYHAYNFTFRTDQSWKVPRRLEIEWKPTKFPGEIMAEVNRHDPRAILIVPTFPTYPMVQDLPKYDDLRGWETSLYLGQPVFKFGSFDVSVTVPAGWM